MMQLPLVQQTISFDDMPNEMRMEIINQMDPESRNALAQLSTGCHGDVQSSPFYIDAVSMVNFPNQEGLVIYVGHRKGRNDYSLTFERSSSTTIDIVRTRSSDRVVIFTESVETILGVYRFAVIYFKDFMISFGKNIRRLCIQGAHFDWDYSEIPTFRRLQELVLTDRQTFTDLIKKIRIPLTHLKLYQEENFSDQLADFGQIYSVLENLTLPKTIVNDDQLCRLQARYIVLPIQLITPHGIVRFIRDWIEGRRNNLLSLRLSWTFGDRFDHTIIFWDFINDYIDENNLPFRIRQHAPNRGVAYIGVNRRRNNLEFTFDAY